MEILITLFCVGLFVLIIPAVCVLIFKYIMWLSDKFL